MTCRLCGGDHRGWERCRRVNEAVLTTPDVLTDAPQNVLTSKDRHKPGYMAEYMRKWRAKQKAK